MHGNGLLLRTPLSTGEFHDPSAGGLGRLSARRRHGGHALLAQRGGHRAGRAAGGVFGALETPKGTGLGGFFCRVRVFSSDAGSGTSHVLQLLAVVLRFGDRTRGSLEYESVVLISVCC